MTLLGMQREVKELSALRFWRQTSINRNGRLGYSAEKCLIGVVATYA